MSKNSVLFAFLISFFVFLMGRELLEIFNIHTIETSFDDVYNAHAEKLLVCSLLCVGIGYRLSKRIRIHKKIVPKQNSLSTYYSIRKASMIIFGATYIVNLFQVYDVVRFVSANGYIAFYVSYKSSVPYLIGKIGDMCPVAFWIYLSSMPTKQESRRTIILYVLYLLVTLGTGKRYPFVAGMLALFVYYVYRDAVCKEEKWIDKREKILLSIGVPTILVGMALINIIRWGNEITLSDFRNAFTDFFYTQGVSISVIKRGLMYSNVLPKGKMYMFGSIIEFLHNNIIGRAIGLQQFVGNTVEHAVKGYSFQHAISYTATGSYYLSGHGLGSCYIAEAFHDLGYIGVIVINLIYGICIRKLFEFYNHGVWMNALLFIALNSLLLSPRGSADGVVAAMLDMTTWGTIIAVYILSKLIRRK